MKKPLLTIASGNPTKVREILEMLGPLEIDVQKQPDSLDVEETGTSYLENAFIKAQAASKATRTWSLADDSGLEVDSLNNAPGIFSARYEQNNEKKLKKILTLLGDTPYRSARFCSAMVLCDSQGNEIASAEGICWGEILMKPVYAQGEFESIFWVREAQCTYGEMSKEQLTKLGSRGKAARKLAPKLIKALKIQ